MKRSQNRKQLKYQVFWARLASFSQLGLVSDPLINYKKSRNWLNNHTGPENLNNTIVKYGKIFYGCYTALIPALVKIDRF